MAPLYRRTPVFVLLSSLAASFVVAAADKLPSIPAAYQLSARIALGEGKRWDYLLVEDATRRLYLAHGDAVDVEDACEGEAAEARTDDRDWCRHDVPFRS